MTELKTAIDNKKILGRSRYLKIFLAMLIHLLVCTVIASLFYFIYLLLSNKLSELVKYWQKLVLFIAILFCVPILGLLSLCFPPHIEPPSIPVGQNLEWGYPKKDFIDNIAEQLISYVKTQCSAEALIKLSPEFEIELVKRNQFDLKRNTTEEWTKRRSFALMPACCIKAAIVDYRSFIINRGDSYWLFVPHFMEETKRLLIKREDCECISSEKICSNEIDAIITAYKKEIFICRWLL